uniref:Uncharacterized protein n=1 Tax=Tanacetum cinerariifolium TaxID=118510 RepID=A0A6L2N6Y8_TANCI|nr:hypothetical protein [Tanacetum cinerariifolium]
MPYHNAPPLSLLHTEHHTPAAAYTTSPHHPRGHHYYHTMIRRHHHLHTVGCLFVCFGSHHMGRLAAIQLGVFVSWSAATRGVCFVVNNNKGVFAAEKGGCSTVHGSSRGERLRVTVHSRRGSVLLRSSQAKRDAKLLEAVEKRFGRNAATKKTKRNLLKQQYENFTAVSSEMLDQTFDWLQKLVSQLELLEEKLS